MTYLPRNRGRRGHGRQALWLLAIFLLGALFFSLFDNLLTRAVSPLWRGENAFSRSLAGFGDFFRTRASLREENASLSERLASLELENAALSLSEAENERLLGLMGRLGEAAGVTVSVLTHPPQSPYDLLVVDAGEREGIAAGSRVFLPEGPEVGTVTQVFPGFSRVRLLSSSGEKTQALLERFEVPVEVEGRGGGNFKIVLPRETPVEVGDRILSGSIRPHLVAVVEEVSLEPTDSFKEVLAKSPANIFSVRYLTIRP